MTRKLVVNQSEAEQVRAIFARFTERGSLAETLEEIEHCGWRGKSWTTRKTNRQRTGARFDRAALVRLLANVTYIGEVRSQGSVYPGEHPAIVDRKAWTKANDLLQSRRREPGARERQRHQALLAGLLECAVCGASMVQGYTTKQGRRYRYYLCQTARRHGAKACPGQIIAARQIENAVVAKIYEPADLPGGQDFPGGVDRAGWATLDRAEQHRILEHLIARIRYDHREEQVVVRWRAEGFGSDGDGETCFRLRKSAVDRHGPVSPDAKAEVHPPRVSRTMALAIRLEGLLKDGVVQNYGQLARLARVSAVRISQILKLRNLAPAIQEQILFLEGAQPIQELVLRRIAEEMDWQRQWSRFEELQVAPRRSAR